MVGETHALHLNKQQSMKYLNLLQDIVPVPIIQLNQVLDHFLFETIVVPVLLTNSVMYILRL